MTRKDLTIAALALLALWGLNQVLVARDGTAFDIVHAKLADLGHDPADYALLDAESSMQLLGRRVAARYRATDASGRTIAVVASRPLAVLPWQIRELTAVDGS